MSITMLIIILLFLLILSAVFSSSETAFTGASRPILLQKAHRGEKRALMFDYLQRNRENTLSSLLLGNNLVNNLATALTTTVLVSIFGDNGVLFATLGITFFILVFSEIFPKTWAMQHATNAAIYLAPIMVFFIVILRPFVWFTNLFVRLICFIFRVQYRVDGDDLGMREKELRGAIDIHQGDGTNNELTARSERLMLRSVLELDDINVSSVLIHRKNVYYLNIDDNAEDFITKIEKSPYRRMPLFREDEQKIVGIIDTKNFLHFVNQVFSLETEDESRAEKMNRIKNLVVSSMLEAWFVPETTSVLEMLHLFQEKRQHFAMVIDEYGTFMGIITITDILEEIVGDISEIKKTKELPVKSNGDGSYNALATTNLRYINRIMGWNLSDEESTTIAGLLLRKTRRIPEVGQIFLIDGFKIEVVERQRHQIKVVRIQPPHMRDNS